MEWYSQLSVSKMGIVKISGAPEAVPDHLMSIKVDAVHDLQWRFPEHTIWLVGEFIHIIRAEGNQTRAPWGEKAFLESYCAMNAKNLLQLAAYLDIVAQDAFNMGSYSLDEDGEKIDPNVSECGAVACAVGHAPNAGLPVLLSDGNDWVTYSRRVFGLAPGEEPWKWCFAGSWEWRDNTPAGAAKRIRYLVEHGVPENAELQRIGMAPYIFAEAA
ncbi:hypothetical protein IB276_33115 [Ensifer sp. ENS04]|uniref:hypothetical protein n=1 Tax=Ensifer sp. ENS04 TaxID=2769281 RepID=UPI00177DA196|nr:hypothetical protein [Ensifer sp. ENS04]MBD9544288.1 hypothetical protein [Ensifer sp. ENS04]